MFPFSDLPSYLVKVEETKEKPVSDASRSVRLLSTQDDQYDISNKEVNVSRSVKNNHKMTKHRRSHSIDPVFKTHLFDGGDEEPDKDESSHSDDSTQHNDHLPENNSSRRNNHQQSQSRHIDSFEDERSETTQETIPEVPQQNSQNVAFPQVIQPINNITVTTSPVFNVPQGGNIDCSNLDLRNMHLKQYHLQNTVDSLFKMMIIVLLLVISFGLLSRDTQPSLNQLPQVTSIMHLLKLHI